MAGINTEGHRRADKMSGLTDMKAWPPFLRGLLTWQFTAFFGSVLTVLLWLLLGRQGGNWSGFGPLLMMCWMISSILSSPLAMLMFFVAKSSFRQAPSLPRLRRRLLRTHDFGAFITLLLMFLATAPSVLTFNGIFDGLVVAVVFPVVGGVTWRRSGMLKN